VTEARELRQILELRDRLEKAENERDALRYLLDELTGMEPAVRLPDVGLRRAEKRILGALLHTPGKRMTAPQLIAAYRADSPYADWPALTTASVHIYHIRRKTAGTGVEITTHWRGEGYSATWKEAAE
jgi:DNA-binding response OmpR family regulator